MIITSALARLKFLTEVKVNECRTNRQLLASRDAQHVSARQNLALRAESGGQSMGRIPAARALQPAKYSELSVVHFRSRPVDNSHLCTLLTVLQHRARRLEQPVGVIVHARARLSNLDG